MGVKRILVLAAVMVVALVLASVALGSALSCAHGSNCTAGSPSAGGQGGPGSGATLPFTGIDLAAIAAVGGLLLVGGLTLQRATRRNR
jgi:hypothetical protein